MPIALFLLAMILLLIPLTVIPMVKQWRYRRTIHARASATAEWAAIFPQNMLAVENFLSIFCDAFLLNRRYRFHFRPEDVVIHIYKHATGPLADEMQLETLMLQMERVFGVDIADGFCRNTTLRDIVEMVERHSHDATLTRVSSTNNSDV